MKDFVPFVASSIMMKRLNKMSWAGYAKMNLPVITDRETYFYGEGFDRLDYNGTILLLSKTIQNVF